MSRVDHSCADLEDVVAICDLDRASEQFKEIKKMYKPSSECSRSTCMVCGVLECPYSEPLHFDKDGCPACYSKKKEEVEQKKD